MPLIGGYLLQIPTKRIFPASVAATGLWSPPIADVSRTSEKLDVGERLGHQQSQGGEENIIVVPQECRLITAERRSMTAIVNMK